MIAVLVLALGTLPACGGGDDRADAGTSSDGPPARAVVLKSDRVLELDGEGEITDEIDDVSGQDPRVDAVAEVVDGELLYHTCCDDYETPEGGTLVDAVGRLHIFGRDDVDLIASSFGVSPDGTRVAALDNLTGDLTIVDVTTGDARTFPTPMAADAPWISFATGGIGWSTDGAMVVVACQVTCAVESTEASLLAFDASSAELESTVPAVAGKADRWPMPLPDGRFAVVEGEDFSDVGDELVAVDLDTADREVLGVLAPEVGDERRGNRIEPVGQAAIDDSGRYVLFTYGGNRGLYSFDIESRTVRRFGDVQIVEWATW